MIKVQVYTKNGRYVSMNVSGHAEYNEFGKDLVCAGVSSIVIGLCNAFEYMHHDTAVVTDNNINITVSNPDDTSQIIMQTGIYQLKTVEEMYRQFIKVKVQEV